MCLETAIREAVGDKKGIRRYGSCILPMDEVPGTLCGGSVLEDPILSYDGAVYRSTGAVIWIPRW